MTKNKTAAKKTEDQSVVYKVPAAFALMVLVIYGFWKLGGYYATLSGFSALYDLFGVLRLVLLAVLIVVFSFASKNFFRSTTLFTILKQVSITGIVCIGQTLVMLTGGIDLSVGSVAGVSAVTAAIFLKNMELPIPITCVLVLIIALIYGIISGLCVTKLNMPPLIATLGMQTSLRGLAYIVTGGLPVYGFTKAFGDFAKGTVAGIPYMVILMIVLFIIFIYGLSKTTMGRYLYAVGGNEKATKLSGIDPRKVYLFAYVNMGLMAGLAGILTVARATQAQPTFGQGYEMDAIAACFIGGASAYGGEGGVFGVVIGAVLMGVINQGMSIMGMEANYQKVVKGVVLLVAIIFDVLSNKKKK